MPRRSERVAHRSLASAKNELPARRQACDFFPLSQVHAAYTLSGFGPVRAKRKSGVVRLIFLPMSSQRFKSAKCCGLSSLFYVILLLPNASRRRSKLTIVGRRVSRVEVQRNKLTADGRVSIYCGDLIVSA